MKRDIDFPIDFVVTWVDNSDQNWKNKRQQFEFENFDDKSETRYRDYDIFQFWFRAVEKYAPWVNKIYLVTDNQIPKWLNLDNPKIVLIDHHDIIDNKYLPTFNSNAIEVNLKNIENLSEHFVLFNDDMFINGPVRPSDFFWFDGRPRDTAGLNAIMPIENFDHITLNNMIIVNKHYKKFKVIRKQFFKFFNFKNGMLNVYTLALLFLPRFTRFFDLHLPYSFLKSEFNRIMDENKNEYEQTSANKFRGINEISVWSIRYTQLASGNFKPRHISFGKYYDLTKINKIVKDIKYSKHKVIDINDSINVSESEFKQSVKMLKKAYEVRLPEKSSFEK